MNDKMTSILVWIPLLPLFGAFLNGLFGRKFSRSMVTTIACSSIGFSFVLALIASAEILGAHGELRLVQTVYNWIAVKGFSIDVSFLLDSLSTVMVLVVTGVSFLIHIYSIGYMKDDPSYHRYFAYLNLFVFSMLVLILGASLPILFVGWEGVGLCSYLLIGFWFEDPEKAKAGKKAFVVNRIGDLGFLIGMFTLFSAVGDLTFDGLSEGASSGAITAGVATFACLALFVGATGKSAQIPLYVWLPDAMAGPTPVSALIHAATMVTAGVYMIARLSFVYALSPTASAVVALVGGCTALFAATIGVTQNDIKKVLAYSTVSQLGYMIIAVGVGAYFAGIFHLMTHAFFKACLFLGSGAVIHALSGEQDMRKMGGLRKKLPWTYWTFLLSTIAIAGFFPFSGFFSKDEILWKTISTTSKADWASWVHITAYTMGIMAAAMTSFYMFRLVFMTFHGEQRSDIHVHHESKVMSWPLAILAFLAVFAGWLNAPLFNIHSFHHFLDPVLAGAQEIAVASTALAENHGAEIGLAAMSFGIAVLGWFVAFTLYIKKTEIPGKILESVKGLHHVVYNKYFVDEFYEISVIKPIHDFSVYLWKKVDALTIDGFGVNGPPRLLRGLGGIGRLLQSGNVQAYAFWLFTGFAGALFYMIYVVGLF